MTTAALDSNAAASSRTTCDACVVDVALDRRSPRRSIWDADPRAGMQHGLLLS